MEAIWVAAEMRAGASFAHSILALDEMREAQAASAVSVSGLVGSSPSGNGSAAIAAETG